VCLYVCMFACMIVRTCVFVCARVCVCRKARNKEKAGVEITKKSQHKVPLIRQRTFQ